MDKEIKYIIAAAGVVIATLMIIIFAHLDIAEHEKNETMLEKYRIDMQYLGEERGQDEY